jgi:preprotein translocase subunit Sec61beta
MPKKQGGSGLHSSAGLIRYFESGEKKSIPINPKLVIIAGFITAILIMIIPKIFPYSL